VIWDYTNQKVRFAGFNYLVSTHIGLIFLVAAFMISVHALGVVGSGQLRPWLQRNPGGAQPGLPAAGDQLRPQVGLLPFHSWLPRAHAAAPAHVSALMSGVIHKAGLYALVRFVLLMGRPDEWMGWFLIAFSLLSAVIGALYTVGPARPEAAARLLVDRERRHRRPRLRRRLPRPEPGATPTLVVAGLRRRPAARAQPRLLQVPAVLRRRRGLPGTHTVDMERLGGLAR
jgi:hypothetical protein